MSKRCGPCQGRPHDCPYLPPKAVRWANGDWSDRNGNRIIPPVCDVSESGTSEHNLKETK